MTKQEFETTCDDGVVLKGILLIPENPKSIIQFNCGTAVKKEFYLRFLTFLAEHNHIVCLWNYRDSGESAPSRLNTCDYRYSDYGSKDMDAIKRFLKSQYPALPFIFVAHSTGGQQIGLMNNLNNVDGAINIAVSSGYLLNMPLAYRIKAYFFFYLFGPISILLKGYLANKQFGLMEDLPKGVAIEWRDWCSKEDYFFDDEFYGKTIPNDCYKNIDFPITVFYSPDDPISNETNTHNFWKHVKSSKAINIVKVENKALGKIDHFDYFKPKLKDFFWSSVLEEIERFIQK
ncbi:alpha/beta hydrolase family protein [Sessilibacter sp. MAH4]